MIQSFSGGFDLVKVDVVEHSRPTAVIPIELYSKLRESHSKDVPLVLKLENSFFTAIAERGVPYKTLALPASREFATDIDDKANLFVIDEDHAQAMFDYYVR